MVSLLGHKINCCTYLKDCDKASRNVNSDIFKSHDIQSKRLEKNIVCLPLPNVHPLEKISSTQTKCTAHGLAMIT